MILYFLAFTRSVSFQVVLRGSDFRISAAMAPHLTPAELDFIFRAEADGKSRKEIHIMLQHRRNKDGIATPCLTP